MISNLERWFKLRVYWWPKDEHWWDGYEDGAYDLIVLDEFKSQKKITYSYRDWETDRKSVV